MVVSLFSVSVSIFLSISSVSVSVSMGIGIDMLVNVYTVHSHVVNIDGIIFLLLASGCVDMSPVLSELELDVSGELGDDCELLIM